MRKINGQTFDVDGIICSINATADCWADETQEKMNDSKGENC